MWQKFLEWLFAPAVAKPAPPPPEPEPPAKPEPKFEEPPWMKIAKGELGQKEIPGGKKNPRIAEYHKAANYGEGDEDDSWCQSFNCYCLEKSGLPSTNVATARSNAERDDLFIELAEPVYGCLAVYNRGTTPATAWQAHVGYFVERVRKGWDKLLGGNQDDAVKYKEYQYSDGKLVGYFWPRKYTLPAGAKVKRAA